MQLELLRNCPHTPICTGAYQCHSLQYAELVAECTRLRAALEGQRAKALEKTQPGRQAKIIIKHQCALCKEPKEAVVSCERCFRSVCSDHLAEYDSYGSGSDICTQCKTSGPPETYYKDEHQ